MDTGSEKRGSKKTEQGWRTPKLSDAEKRRRASERSFNWGKTRAVGPDEVPF